MVKVNSRLLVILSSVWVCVRCSSVYFSTCENISAFTELKLCI